VGNPKVFIHVIIKGTGPKRCWAVSNSISFHGSLEALGLARTRFGRWFGLLESAKWGWKHTTVWTFRDFFYFSFLTSVKSWLGSSDIH